MHSGYRIVEDMIDGFANWAGGKGFQRLGLSRGKGRNRIAGWKDLILNYKLVARIDPDTCIGCQLCYTACWDGAHQCIHLDRVGANGAGHRTPAQVEAESRRKITVTPAAR